MKETDKATNAIIDRIIFLDFSLIVFTSTSRVSNTYGFLKFRDLPFSLDFLD